MGDYGTIPPPPDDGEDPFAGESAPCNCMHARDGHYKKRFACLAMFCPCKDYRPKK